MATKKPYSAILKKQHILELLIYKLKVTDLRPTLSVPKKYIKVNRNKVTFICGY